MFKNFNHKFVYNYPLIWNTKIIPFLLISLLIHLLFFAVGYQNAIVHSVQIHNYYNQDSNAITINLFAILISVLVSIIWCVLYFRNNAFKAFYPKTNNALFKEWMLILIFCLSTFSYALSAVLGANVQMRSNMSHKVVLERCETISKASMFLQGSFKESNWEDKTVNGKIIQVQRDSFPFEGKRYALNSLMNKNMEMFPSFNSESDSLRRLQVQRWMKRDDKAQILKIFQDYFAVANEHKLKSNISAEQWMDLVYNYPEFTTYKVIGTSERDLLYEYGFKENEVVMESDDVISSRDTTTTTIKTENEQQYVYSKYYVSHKPLYRFYAKVAEAWGNSLVDLDYIMVVLYLGFGGSLLVFSFRVTSARKWTISLIAMGVVQIIFGIGTALFSYSLTFPMLYLLYFLLVFVYFIVVYYQKKGKKLSGIALNQMLWLLPGFLPMIYVIVMDFVKKYSGYNNRYNFETGVVVEEFPKIDWIETNVVLLAQLNLLLLVFVLFLLSRVIKKWRGIPEE
ncbi:hypothetical protein FLAN108750_02655 [Flavobacterium antarcticum]